MVGKQDDDSIQRFIRWPVIEGTMFVGDAPYMKEERDCIAGAGEKERWETGLRDEGECGAKISKLFKEFRTTGNAVHQGYHLLQWERASGRKIGEVASVIEFGGGYGTMARICRQLGFKGTYAIYDLPEFSLLQEFYLSQVGINDVRFFSDDKPISCELLIALWSISEVPPVDRMEFLRRIEVRSCLFAYAETWDGWRNKEWFRHVAKISEKMIWKEQKIKWLPGHRYMIGRPR
jgi:hypothetical protein